MFSPQGPSLRELAVQALSSVEGGYDLLAAKFDHTPFRTPDGILDATAVALRRELATIPDRGWAVDREEGNVGVSCVAAPIFGPAGTVVSAVSVTGPSALVRPDRVGPAVRLAASAASRAYSSRR